MYGLSRDTDLSPMHGSTLTLVGVGLHQLTLAFSGDVSCSVSIEGDYVLTRAGVDPVTFRDAVGGAPALLPLLGRTVVSADVPVEGTVRVSFDDGSVVEVLDSETDFESYQVTLGGHVLVV